MAEEHINRLIRSVQNSSPAYAREAAIELWKIGETEIAFQAILAQFLEYKKPKEKRYLHIESSFLAALILGEFKDKRAIPYLIESLSSDLRFESAYVLSLIGGSKLEEDLLNLSQGNTDLVIFANLTLGYMLNMKAVQNLINYLSNIDELAGRYSERFAHSLNGDILNILAICPCREINEIFTKKIRKEQLFGYLSSYCEIISYPKAFKSNHPCKQRLRSEIVMKFFWHKFIMSEEDIRAFIPTFQNQHLVPLQEKIIDQIWNEIKSTEPAH